MAPGVGAGMRAGPASAVSVVGLPPGVPLCRPEQVGADCGPAVDRLPHMVALQKVMGYIRCLGLVWPRVSSEAEAGAGPSRDERLSPREVRAPQLPPPRSRCHPTATGSVRHLPQRVGAGGPGDSPAGHTHQMPHETHPSPGRGHLVHRTTCKAGKRSERTSAASGQARRGTAPPLCAHCVLPYVSNRGQYSRTEPRPSGDTPAPNTPGAGPLSPPKRRRARGAVFPALAPLPGDPPPCGMTPHVPCDPVCPAWPSHALPTSVGQHAARTSRCSHRPRPGAPSAPRAPHGPACPPAFGLQALKQ